VKKEKAKHKKGKEKTQKPVTTTAAVVAPPRKVDKGIR
jgi:hypothetical protein